MAVGDSSGWMCNSSRTNFVFRAENSRSWSQDVPQVWGCEPASLPIPAGALIPSQTAHQLPPSLSGCCQKHPSSFSLSGKKAQPILGGTGARPRGLRSPSPAAQLAAASTVLISRAVQETSGTGDNCCCPANAGANVLVMKLSLCWGLLLCRDLERRSSGVDVGTLHPAAAAGFSVM